MSDIFRSFLPTGSLTFTSSGPFLVPSNIDRVFLYGAGGGSGGAGGSATQGNGGGGGGGSQPMILLVDVTPGDSWLVTIGAGGGPGVGAISGIGGAGGGGSATTFSKGGLVYQFYGANPTGTNGAASLGVLTPSMTFLGGGSGVFVNGVTSTGPGANSFYALGGTGQFPSVGPNGRSCPGGGGGAGFGAGGQCGSAALGVINMPGHDGGISAGGGGGAGGFASVTTSGANGGRGGGGIVIVMW